MDSVATAAALARYRKAAAARPLDELPLEYVALTLGQMGRLPESEHAYTSVLRLAPRYAAAYFNLGNAQRQQAHGIERAKSSYEAALGLAPRWAAVYINLGVSAGDDMEEALRAYTSALLLQAAGHAHTLRTL